MRTLDPTLLNEVANRPTVRPLLHGCGHIDFTPYADDPENFLFESVRGGYLMIRVFEEVYEGHTVYEPGKGSAREALRTGEKVIRHMFTQTPALELVGKIPDYNEPSIKLAHMLGFRQEALRDRYCYMNLPLDRWISTCSTAELRGRAFLEHLGQPHDQYLGRRMGAALDMINAGYVEKGVDTWNRRAVMALQEPMKIVSTTPLVLEIDDVIIGRTKFGWEKQHD